MLFKEEQLHFDSSNSNTEANKSGHLQTCGLEPFHSCRIVIMVVGFLSLPHLTNSSSTTAASHINLSSHINLHKASHINLYVDSHINLYKNLRCRHTGQKNFEGQGAWVQLTGTGFFLVREFNKIVLSNTTLLFQFVKIGYWSEWPGPLAQGTSWTNDVPLPFPWAACGTAVLSGQLHLYSLRLQEEKLSFLQCNGSCQVMQCWQALGATYILLQSRGLKGCYTKDGLFKIFNSWLCPSK